METATDAKAYGAANMTSNKQPLIPICLPDALTVAMTWSLAHMEHVTDQLEREICDITLFEQVQFNMKLNIRNIRFESYWETIRIVGFWILIAHWVIHSRYLMMHVQRHKSESIWWTGSGFNRSHSISKWLHIANTQGRYQSRKNFNYIQHIGKHNCLCTGGEYTNETQWNVAH